MTDTADAGGVTVSVDARPDGVVLVAVAGDVDLNSAPIVSKALAAAQSEELPVLLDTRQVGFLGSAGLSVLVDAARHAREVDGRLAVLVTQHAVRRAIEVTGLDSVLSLFDAEADAVRFLLA